MKFLEILENRKSSRMFKDIELNKEVIDELKQSINLSPTSFNLHNFSAIFVTDKDTKKKISTNDMITSCSLLVVFCIDVNRVEVKAMSEFDKYSMSLLNIGIAVNNLTTMTSYLNLSYGFNYSINKNNQTMKGILNLNDSVVPIIAVAIGHSKEDSDIKPKLNKIYDEKYDLELVKKEVENYDEIMNQYYLTRDSNNKDINWTNYSKDIVLDSKELKKSLNKIIKIK